jgi:hypothetical protein
MIETFHIALENLSKLQDKFAELALSALREQGELDADSGFSVTRANDPLDAEGKLAHGEGHFHGFRSEDPMAFRQIEQASTQAQICDFSAATEAGGHGAHLRLTSAQKPRMPPSIFSVRRHATPFRP